MAASKGHHQVLILRHIIRVLCRFVKRHKEFRYCLSSNRTKYFSFEGEVKDRSCGSFPINVPKGHCAVYVGTGRTRFVIPAEYLNHSLLRALLDKAAEEYGYDHQMGLTIPCEEGVFHYLTSMLRKKDPTLTNMELDELVKARS